MLPYQIPGNRKEVCLEVKRNEFVLAVAATVAAYYIVKCLDWFITLITG